MCVCVCVLGYSWLEFLMNCDQDTYWAAHLTVEKKNLSVLLVDKLCNVPPKRPINQCNSELLNLESIFQEYSKPVGTVNTRQKYHYSYWTERNPEVTQLPGSHGGWQGKPVCRLVWRSVLAGGRQSRLGGTRRGRMRTRRSIPSSSLVTWEDALQIAPAGKLSVPHDVNKLWTEMKKHENVVVSFFYPLFMCMLGDEIFKAAS